MLWGVLEPPVAAVGVLGREDGDDLCSAPADGDDERVARLEDFSRVPAVGRVVEERIRRLKKRRVSLSSTLSVPVIGKKAAPLSAENSKTTHRCRFSRRSKYDPPAPPPASSAGVSAPTTSGLRGSQ